MATSTRTGKTFDQYKAERREQQTTGNPLDDYDPKVSARVTGRGVPRDWPFCQCGAANCPDKAA